MQPIVEALQKAADAATAMQAEHERQLDTYKKRLGQAMARERALQSRVGELEQQLRAAQAEAQAMRDHPTVKARLRAEAAQALIVAQNRVKALQDAPPAE